MGQPPPLRRMSTFVAKLRALRYGRLSAGPHIRLCTSFQCLESLPPMLWLGSRSVIAYLTSSLNVALVSSFTRLLSPNPQPRRMEPFYHEGTMLFLKMPVATGAGTWSQAFAERGSSTAHWLIVLIGSQK